MPHFDPAEAPMLLRVARLAAGATQREFAASLGIAQPNLAAIESGRRTVSAEYLAELLEAAGYRPSLALARARDQVLESAAKYGFSNVRVFGSIAAGTDDFGSDIDLLVDAPPAIGIEFGLLADDIEQLTGFPVDLLIDRPGKTFIEAIRPMAVAV